MCIGLCVRCSEGLFDAGDFLGEFAFVGEQHDSTLWAMAMRLRFVLHSSGLSGSTGVSDLCLVRSGAVICVTSRVNM